MPPARISRGYQPGSYDADTAIDAGRLHASQAFEREENDRWIAATPARFGWPLVTRDQAFGCMPALKVIGY